MEIHDLVRRAEVGEFNSDKICSDSEALLLEVAQSTHILKHIAGENDSRACSFFLVFCQHVKNSVPFFCEGVYGKCGGKPRIRLAAHALALCRMIE